MNNDLRLMLDLYRILSVYFIRNAKRIQVEPNVMKNFISFYIPLDTAATPHIAIVYAMLSSEKHCLLDYPKWKRGTNGPINTSMEKTKIVILYLFCM